MTTAISEDYASIAQGLRELEGGARRRYGIWYAPADRGTHGWISLPDDGGTNWRSWVPGEPIKWVPTMFDTIAEAQAVIDGKPDGRWSREDMSVREYGA